MHAVGGVEDHHNVRALDGLLEVFSVHCGNLLPHDRLVRRYGVEVRRALLGRVHGSGQVRDGTCPLRHRRRGRGGHKSQALDRIRVFQRPHLQQIG